MINYTAGPWVASRGDGGPYWSVWNSEALYYRVATVPISGRLCDPAIIEANAKLIAAAPDMLKALENLADYYADKADLGNPMLNFRLSSAIKQAREAISKAKGK